MEKNSVKAYNGSYLYRLNEELSGQAEIDPYFSAAEQEQGDLPREELSGENTVFDSSGPGELS